MTHKVLDLYKMVMRLAKEIYEVTRSSPKEGIYGLTSLMRRAAVSVPSNISEGTARDSSKERSPIPQS